MTVTKEEICVINKQGNDFDGQVDFIKQIIVKLLASTSNIRFEENMNFIDKIRNQMSN